MIITFIILYELFQQCQYLIKYNLLQTNNSPSSEIKTTSVYVFSNEYFLDSSSDVEPSEVSVILCKFRYFGVNELNEEIVFSTRRPSDRS